MKLVPDFKSLFLNAIPVLVGAGLTVLLGKFGHNFGDNTPWVVVGLTVGSSYVLGIFNNAE